MYELISLIIEKIIQGSPIWGVSVGLIHLVFIFYFKRKFVSFTITSIFLIIYIFLLYPLLFVGSGIGADSLAEVNNFDFDEATFWLMNLLSVNWIPSKRHLQLYLLVSTFYLLFWIIINIIFIKIKNSYKNLKLIKKYFEYFVISFIIIIPIYSKIYDVIISYSKMSREYSDYSKNFNNNLSDLNFIQKNNGLNVLLYIGESTSSLHMNIYGYPRNTTPLLKKIKTEDENLIILQNVWSNHTHTSASLLRALSFDYEERKEYLPLTIIEKKRLSITDLLNKADIQTHLYSNQGKTGSWNLAASIIFKNASSTFSTNDLLLGNNSGIQNKPLDHKFFNEYFNEIVKVNQNNDISLNVFHAYAGHGPYRKFIGEKFRKNVDNFYLKKDREAIFGESTFFINNQLEQYDSAISYIDFSISNVIEKIKLVKKPIVFIYFSDHGESPFTARGHDSSRFVNEMARIPFLIYFNEQAKLLRPDLFQKYKNLSNKNNTSTLEQLPATILDMLNIEIKTPNFFADKILNPIGYEAEKKPILIRKIGNKYSYVRINDFNLLDQKKYIDSTDDATKHYIYSKKYESENIGICYHRANSIAKMIRGNFNSNCLEVDIFVKNEKILINHPPATQVNLNLEIIDKILKPNSYLWIDGKNINNYKNCNLVYTFLKNSNNLPQRTLLEFPSNTTKNNQLDKCISSLKLLGVSTSIYIPTKLGKKCNDQIINNIKQKNSKDCTKFLQVMKNAIQSNYFTDISYDYKIHNLIKELKYSEIFKLNAWNIEHKSIDKLNLKNFRLLITNNEDPNYR